MAIAGNLATRILSALVLVPIALGAIYLGGTAYLCFILATVLVAQAEWMRLVAPGVVIWIHIVAFTALILEALATLFFGFLTGIGVIIGGSLLVLGVVRLTRAAGARRIALGVLYIGATMVATLWLRDLPEIGLGLTCFLFGSVWATDIGAYAAGKTIGGPKLAPRLSPNKTWAGLIGGMVSAAIAGFLIALAFDAGLRFVAAAVAAVLAVIAQSGDLFESAVKRRAGVKDSGTLIPGHGGVLDRIDGLMAAAPLLAIWQLAVGERLAWW